ncbi:PRC-barrel domain-containing protein [Paenibacillus pinihumi]|uniref:PRC-barrel domain-containing protein n=1 Tax=Paenibacillus pinihumi TaxID=669462 RepID=UPI0003F8FB43|nr:PRC-barrel domain-containing protein [Paenibacillus pinihumi]
MIKVQHLIGLPVIDYTTGKQAGIVKDIWFDEHWVLKGMIVDTGRWMARGITGLLWETVVACGEDAVLISDRQAMRKLVANEVTRCFQTGMIRLKDLPVITQEGFQLGRISDVYFDQNMGTPIVGYELTDGFISDLKEGRKWLRISDYPDEVTLGEDAILVPVRAEEDLEHMATSESVN